ncbi:MAG: DNA polymerase I [bacterium]|nr:DNA polymerase I [bacterium]
MHTKIFLVDGSSYLYRAFYAIAALSNSKGLPTNAIYGFTSMLLKLLKDESPEYLAICFDLPEPTFRHQEFVQYKATRKPTPDDLVIQIPWVKKIVRAMGITILELPGFEADDIMGTLAKRAEQEGYDVVLVTGDKDMLQLVNKHIRVLRIHRGEQYVYDETKIIEKYGVPPSKFPDFVGLMGDSSDNIPGVPGIGEKIAARLINEYGDLDGVLNHINAIKGDKLQEQLKTNIEQARLSKKLATIDTSVPLEVKVDDLKISSPNYEELTAIFRELEFNRLLAELPQGQTSKSAENVVYQTIESASGISKLKKELDKHQKIYVAISQRNKQMTAVALSLTERKNYVILWNDETKDGIREILQSKRLQKIGFDLKQQTILAKKNGIELTNAAFDIFLAGYLLTSQPPQSLTLRQLAMTYLKKSLSAVTPSDDLLTSEPSAMTQLIEEANVIRELATIMEQKLVENDLTQLFYDIEMPLIPVLAEMELAGIKIDKSYFSQLSEQFEKELKKQANKIFELAGEEFNINSPKQLQAILFEKLKLPVKKKTKTGYSTDVDVLEELATLHPLPAKILEYRTLTKMKSTYVDAVLSLVDPETMLLHTSFNQAGTATGRFSSSEPNLQNLPAQGDWADKIRAGYIPRVHTNVFLSADYSQIELRILAHLSQDEKLLDIFKNNEDIHTQTAIEIFNVLPELVTGEMRRAAKVVNFGIIYGLSPFGLSQSLKISQEEAKAYIARYFARYPRVKEYITQTISFAREKGYVTTLYNRRRYLPDINSPNRDLREFSERAAINSPIQGTAADLLKRAMLNVYRRMKKEKLTSLILLTIHDELVFEVPKSELNVMQAVVKQEMESVARFTVPLVVNIKVGKNLAEC